MKMKLFVGLVLTFAGLASCSSDVSQPSGNGTVATDSVTENNSHFKPFEVDPFWVTPTETVSQYGPAGIIRDVVIDQNGIIWMAAWDGIVSYDGKKFTNHTLKNGLSHHRVYAVMKDSKDNIWFGTLGAGVYKYDGVGFTNLSENNGLVHNHVMDITEDSKGNIWFATNGGVSKYDGSTFMNLADTNGLYNQIYALAEDDHGVMWMGGESGLFQYDPSLSKFMVDEVFTSYETSYSNVRDLHYSNGVVYMGCASGFYKTIEKGASLSPLTSINDNFTGYIHPSNTTDLLLTSNGIERYNTTEYQPHESPGLRWTTIVADKSNLGIFGAREANDGTIWYGAMDGLHSVKDGKDVAYRKP